ncbi:MAG: nitrous oxide reductase accessory protein NosL [Campylobacterales bacterium]|nr:nitrous oxide reductase accessory protein NosL [Campylobacterales bacterium]
MIKVLLFIFVVLFMSACTTQNAPQTKKAQKTMPKMFQTVSESEATLVQEGKNKHYCVRCGMNLVKFYKTSHAASQNDKRYQYCSIHCLAEHLDEGNELKNPTVVDVTSLKMIPLLNAHYVVGSSVRGTMSKVSKYAFENIEDAQAFQKKYGGKILDFHGALQVAREDFN